MWAGNISGLWPQIRADLNGMNYRPAGGMFIVEGTVYPGAPWPPIPETDYGTGVWSGFAAAVAGGVTNQADGLWYIETIGYPAVTTPMWPSILIGAANLAASVRAFADLYKSLFGVFPPINLVGWSQGAAAVDVFWMNYVFNPSGSCHDLLDFVYTIYNCGDVLRTPGISHGDDLAGLPGPGTQDGVMTGGIGGPQDLTAEQTNVVSPLGRPVVLSFNNHGDLYGAAPTGPDVNHLAAAGQMEYNFFTDIMHASGTTLIKTGLGFFNIVGDIEGGWNAIKFFAAGNNAPHFQYWPFVNWAVQDIIRVGYTLPHAIGV
jgi:hypothetical protein